MDILEKIIDDLKKTDLKLFNLFDNGKDIKTLDTESAAFIKNKFIKIGKGDCFNFYDLNSDYFSKSFHSIILYFLGINLRKTFESYFERIKNKYFFCPDMDNPLEYVWRLTSFFHDVMTMYEKRKTSCIIKKFLSCLTCPSLTVKTFLNVCNDLPFERIRYTIFNSNKNSKLIKITKSIIPINPTYNMKIVNRYFRKRLTTATLDHGIISGFVFYNQLVKNYLIHLEKVNPNYINEEFNDGELRYRPVHLLLFKYIADAIIVHNIWHYNENSKEEYKLWGLKELSNKNRLSLKKNPLAFMLGLLDTLEPVKYFTNKNEKPTPKEILSVIEIIPDEKEKSLILKLSDKYEDRPEWKQYFNEWYHDKAEGMKDWLEVEVWKGENVINISILE